MTALDLLQENTDRVNFESNSRNLTICAYAQDASAKWPVSDHILDIAIDIFCYKHIVEKEKQKNTAQSFGVPNAKRLFFYLLGIHGGWFLQPFVSSISGYQS